MKKTKIFLLLIAMLSAVAFTACGGGSGGSGDGGGGGSSDSGGGGNEGNSTRTINYSRSGADGVWFNSDDVVGGYGTTTY
ncbi:MAG: hypothetical protein AABY39_10655 [Nitrospirota bacterium]